jgi:ethanolamine utilization protein EutP (predicted NTPase)
MKKLTEDTYTSKYADDVRNCYVQGLQLIRNLNTMKADFDVIRYIGSIQTQIAALNNRLAHLGFAAGPRMEPLMVTFMEHREKASRA